MRAFISLNLSNETISILKDFQKSIKEDLGIAESGKVKWESPDKFHITMFFIGDISDDKIDKLKDDLKTIHDDNIGTIILELIKLNAFPDLLKPRVLFAEVMEREGKIYKLSGLINKIMKEYGYEQKGKFHPHITLGRVRREYNLHELNFGDKTINSSFKIQEVHLMKSVLSREGSVHERVFLIEL